VTVRDVLAALRASGEVRVVEGRLHIRGSQSALTPKLRAAVEECKPELITALEAEAAAERVCDGRDIVAALADRGITVRLAEDGTIWAGPANLIDEADRALLAAHRGEVLADLRARDAVVQRPEIGCGHPHVVISNGVLEGQQCDMRRRVRPAAEGESLGPERHRESQAASGLRAAHLVDEADRDLPATHRDAAPAALAAESAPSSLEPAAIGADDRAHDIVLGPACTCLVHVEVPAGSGPEVVDEIASVLTRYPGGDDVLLHIRVEDCEVTMQVGERFRVAGGQPLKAALDAQFQREIVRLEPIQPAAGGLGISGVVPGSGGEGPPTGVATGALVPGQQGRPASTGAEPTGWLEPGTAAPAALQGDSDAQRCEPEPADASHPQDAERSMPATSAGANGGGQAPPRVEAGAQAFDVEPVLVTTAAELEGALPEILATPTLGFDTEGTGLDPLTAGIRLVQLATGRRSYLVDVFRLPLSALQPIFDGGRRLIGHNLKFDLRMLCAGGIALPTSVGSYVFDTMLASRLLGAGDRDQKHGLADVALRCLGLKLNKTEQTSDWSGDLSLDQLRYAAKDAAVLVPLQDRLSAELEGAGLAEVSGIEHRALPAVAWLEQSGALFDADRWLALAEAADRRRRQVEVELDRLAPPEMPCLPMFGTETSSSRWNSPDQVRRLLRQRGVDIASTAVEALKANQERDPLIGLLVEHREAAKAVSTYGRDYLKHVHATTGRIHATYHQLGSAAGRMSCARPNLQQIPRALEYRTCFRAPEGRVLVGADYGQIEPRVAAEISSEEQLISAYRDRADVYRRVANDLGTERSVAKTVVLGALYGLGARGLVSRLKTDAGIDITEPQARSYLDTFFASYPRLDRWRRSFPRDTPVDTRTLSGRRRLAVADYTRKINSPIQGSAADIFKVAMGLLFETRAQVPDARLVLSVHDELVLEVAEPEADAARTWLARCMREAGERYLKRVPVVAEVGIGLSWAETKKSASPVEEDSQWAA